MKCYGKWRNDTVADRRQLIHLFTNKRDYQQGSQMIIYNNVELIHSWIPTRHALVTIHHSDSQG